MNGIEIARSWDQIPPVIQDGNASISTRYLVHKYRAMQDAILEFIDRCDKGEVRSKYTYEKFKQILEHIPKDNLLTENIKPGQKYLLCYGPGNFNNRFFYIKEVFDEGACIVIKEYIQLARVRRGAEKQYKYKCKDLIWFKVNAQYLQLECENTEE